jgi:hypothetical protein
MYLTLQIDTKVKFLQIGIIEYEKEKTNENLKRMKKPVAPEDKNKMKWSYYTNQSLQYEEKPPSLKIAFIQGSRRHAN